MSGYSVNVIKSQDIKLIHRNPLPSYRLTWKFRKRNYGNNLIHHFNKRIKYRGINLPKETKTCMPKTIRHWWKKSNMTEQMERYIMLLYWKVQYCENDYTTQSNLQIQCNPYQTTNGIFQELKQKFSQFVWKHKRLQIAKTILRKKNGTRGIKLPDFRL